MSHNLIKSSNPRALLSFMFALLALLPTAPIMAQTGPGATLMTAETGQLKLEISKGSLIRLDRPAAQIFVADPAIADIQIKSPKIIYILGKARGETSLYALDEKDEVIYSSIVSVTQSLDLLRRSLDELLPDATIETRPMGSMVILKGYVSSPIEAETADSIARRLVGDEFVINQLTVVQPTQVNLRVRFAEVSRTVLKELGVSWESFFSSSDVGVGIFRGRNVFEDVEGIFPGTIVREFDPGNSSGIVSRLTTGNLDLNFAIDALDEAGFLTVLAEPNLTAISGETANFLAGGEFPIPVPSRDGLGIDFREFGVSLEFTPTVLNSGRINMKVAPEVSDLSSRGSINIQNIAVPSISTRRAETTIELGSGQSFAIAGLLQNQIRQEASKIPGLGDLPILGALFTSDDFRREESELLIVVTPYLVRPVSERKLALPTDGFIAPGDMDRYLHKKQWKARSAEAPTPAANQAKGPELKKRAGFQLQ